jgi:hypothetical protein
MHHHIEYRQCRWSSRLLHFGLTIGAHELPDDFPANIHQHFTSQIAFLSPVSNKYLQKRYLLDNCIHFNFFQTNNITLHTTVNEKTQYHLVYLFQHSHIARSCDHPLPVEALPPGSSFDTKLLKKYQDNNLLLVS